MSQPECPAHPGVPSVFTCSRCGSFGCDECQAEALPPRCHPCQARHEAARAFTILDLLADTFRLIGRSFPWALLVPPVHVALVMGLARLSVAGPVMSVGSLGASALVNALWVSLFDAVRTEGATVQLGAIVTRAFTRLLAVFGAVLIAALPLTLGCVFFVVPGVIIGARLLLVGPFIVLERRSTFTALELSWNETRAFQWKLAGALAVGGSILFAGTLAGIVVGLVEAPLELKEAIRFAVTVTAAVPIHALMVAAHARLRS